MALFTGAADGDQRPVVEGHRSAPHQVPGDLRIVGVHQVHGGDVLAAPDGIGHNDAELQDGDAVLATDEVTCAAILVADCVPIAIGSPEGIRVAVHAGWRGLVAGVVRNAASAARAAGATSLVAALGPCIGPCCYEFSPADLEEVQSALGLQVGATTDIGAPALDLRACALASLEAADVDVSFVEPRCTSCAPGWYSARARKDRERQALYVWRTRRVS